MLDLVRLYIANILEPMFEGCSEYDELLSPSDHNNYDQNYGATSDGERFRPDQLQGHEEKKSQAFSLSDSERAKCTTEVQSATGRSQPDRQATWRAVKEREKRNHIMGTDILDSSGPKLIHGERLWLLFYQVVGQINWLGRPLYLSIVYKFCIMGLVFYIGWRDFIQPSLNIELIDTKYRNPIFLFICFLGLVVTAAMACVNLYSNLFSLCPFFKVLTTPRLCFIKTEVQQIVGNSTLAASIIFMTYQSILLKLVTLKDYNEFVTNFSLTTMVIDSFALICFVCLTAGVYQLDFYIRFCFGYWIIALRNNLKYRFSYLEHHRRRKHTIDSSRHRSSFQTCFSQLSQVSRAHTSMQMGAARSLSLERLETSGDRDQDNVSHETSTTLYTNNDTISRSELKILDSFRQEYKLDSLDEIRHNLNTMDDHLEVCRGIQTNSLVLIYLNAFLANGTFLLIAYNLLANRGDYYHGVILVLATFNNSFIVFLCYIGDSWILYALSNFVQTVEDQYFLQGGEDTFTLAQIKLITSDIANSHTQLMAGGRSQSWPKTGSSELDANTCDVEQDPDLEELLHEYRSLFIIEKKDVFFCREFLNQFKEHLSTPWSKLTVMIHLKMIGTFVTLIAAQIIFDHEQ